jgi:hypothetical protein
MIPGEIQRPMTSDNHITICRFKSNTDSRYESVLEVLEGFAKAAVSSQ